MKKEDLLSNARFVKTLWPKTEATKYGQCMSAIIATATSYACLQMKPPIFISATPNFKTSGVK
jgi:hypothetical protein